ncbi:MAG: histidine kinase [Nakamurella sp.]
MLGVGRTAGRSERSPLAGVGPAGSGRSARVGPLDLLLAAAVVVPSMIALAALTGVPTEWVQLAAWCLPVASGAAVLLCRRYVPAAVAMLTVGITVGVPAGNEIEAGLDVGWGELASLSPLISAGVVFYALGATSTTRQSLSLLIISMLVCSLPLGPDVPLLMIAIGWWLVGRVLRSRQLVADQLNLRAAELAAERERFVLEQVRLERTKIARELHDVVAHCMTVIVIQARAGQHLLTSDPPAAAEAADVIRAVAAEAESDIGALVELMNPTRVVPLSAAVLDELIARAAATGTTVRVRITGAVGDLDPGVAAIAHRIVQESLTNAFRHAPGAGVRIDLDCERLVRLDVTNEAPLIGLVSADGRQRPGADDNPPTNAGPGLQLSLTGAGRGLLGMQERVTAAGGRLSWGPAPAGGWYVQTILPQPLGGQQGR